MSWKADHHKPAREPDEIAARELQEARRIIAKLEHRCAAIESTLATVGRLSLPYVPVVNGKPLARTAPSQWKSTLKK